MQDVNYATRWLKAHAADFNGDPESVAGLGSYHGWKGEAVPVYPDRGHAYDVVADAEAERVQRWRLERETVMKGLTRFYSTEEGADPVGEEPLRADQAPRRADHRG